MGLHINFGFFNMKNFIEENELSIKYNEDVNNKDELLDIIYGYTTEKVEKFTEEFCIEITLGGNREDVLMVINSIINREIDGYYQTIEWLCHNRFIPISETFFYRP